MVMRTGQDPEKRGLLMPRVHTLSHYLSRLSDDQQEVPETALIDISCSGS